MILTVVKDYESDRPAAPFLAVVLRRRFITLYKRDRSPTQKPAGKSIFSLNEPQNACTTADVGKQLELGDIIPDKRENPDLPDHREEAVVKWRKIVGKLSAYERRVLINRANGLTMHESAAREGVEWKSIDNALCRADSKIAGKIDSHGVGRRSLPRYVYPYSASNKYRVTIKPSKRRGVTEWARLGPFDTVAEATAARDEWLATHKL